MSDGITNGELANTTRFRKCISPMSPVPGGATPPPIGAPGIGVRSGVYWVWHASQAGNASATPSLVGTQRRSLLVPSGIARLLSAANPAGSRTVASNSGSRVRMWMWSTLSKMRFPAASQSASVVSASGSISGCGPIACSRSQ